MSKVVKSSDDGSPITNASQDADVRGSQSRPSHKIKSPRTSSSRWRLAKIQSARGLIRLRAVRTSSWFTVAGLCLVVWALTLHLWPESKPQNVDNTIDHLVAGAELGAVDLGTADENIQQVEFLSESSTSPDTAFLPWDVDAPETEATSSAESAGDHDSPAWLLGTIEDEPTQKTDTILK